MKANRWMSPEERFWLKVNRRGPIPEHRPDLGPCWEWTYLLSKKGYGVFLWHKPKIVRAHRASWYMAHGEWPELDVLHHCDNRKCVNPGHLFLGDNADNVADMVSKERQRGAPGERNGFNTRLTENDVVDIRTLAAFGATQTTLKDAFDVSQQTISAVLTRRIWRHVA